MAIRNCLGQLEFVLLKFLAEFLNLLQLLLVLWLVLWVLFNEILVDCVELFVLLLKLCLLSLHLFASELIVILSNFECLLKFFLVREHFLNLSSEVLLPCFQLILLLLHFCDLSLKIFISLFHGDVFPLLSFGRHTKSLVVSLESCILVLILLDVSIKSLFHLHDFLALQLDHFFVRMTEIAQFLEVVLKF